MSNPGDSDNFRLSNPAGYDWCSDPGAVLTFKMKRFLPPMVGNRGDSDTKGENDRGYFDKKFSNVRIPWFCSGGGAGDSY